MSNGWITPEGGIIYCTQFTHSDCAEEFLNAHRVSGNEPYIDRFEAANKAIELGYVRFFSNPHAYKKMSTHFEHKYLSCDIPKNIILAMGKLQKGKLSKEKPGDMPK